MTATDSLEELAKKLTKLSQKPLKVRKTDDGGLVVITYRGQKFTYTSEQVKKASK